MAKAKDNSKTPERVYVKTELSAGFVDQYWEKIDGMTEEKWLYELSPARRHELTFAHMMGRLSEIEGD